MVLFFIDGVNHRVFNKMLAEGQLPDIEQYLVRRGCIVDQAVTAAPSITYAITATFATGVLPGHHGVLGNKIFDRDRLLLIDYNTIETYHDIDLDYHVPNIYEILDDTFSVTIQTPLTRGAYYRIDNWATSGTCWFFGWYETVDRWVARRFSLIGQTARKAKQWPGFIFAYMPATDEIGHRCGAGSQRYRDSLANVDRQIGHICRALQRNNLLEETFLVMVVDHGMADCEKEHNLDLKKLLEQSFHLRLAMSGPNRKASFTERSRYFRRFDGVLTDGSGRCVALHLKNGPDWSKAAGPEQITPIANFLGDNAGIALVAYRRTNGIVVQNRLGRGLIQRQGSPAAMLDQKQYSYRVIDGGDPLGYNEGLYKNEVLSGEFHTAGTWLKETARSGYPDLPVQIMEMFDSRRAGDIVIFAAQGWNFDKHLIGGHGGVSPEDMLVPMIFAGPGIAPGSHIDTACVVDVAPTVIDMMDSDKLNGHRFDGHSLLPAMARQCKETR